MVELLVPNQITRVRFPSPAPYDGLGMQFGCDAVSSVEPSWHVRSGSAANAGDLNSEVEVPRRWRLLRLGG